MNKINFCYKNWAWKKKNYSQSQHNCIS